MIRSSVNYVYDTRSDHLYPCLGMYSSKYRPDIFWHVGSTIDGANVPFYVVFSWLGLE